MGPPITVVTSNENKFKEIQEMTPNIRLVRKDFDLTEIQDTLEEIVKYKCAQAAYLVNGPVLVEDTGLEFNALNCLPGPYVKHFVKEIGSQGLYDLLEKYEDKSAKAVCYLAFTEGPNKIIHCFKGVAEGTIVEPRGISTFDWDNIFVPKDYDQTFSEMGNLKNEISHRRKSVNVFSRFIVDQIIKSLDKK